MYIPQKTDVNAERNLEKKLQFAFLDVSVEFKPELLQHVSQDGLGHPLCGLEITLRFPSGKQTQGSLCYDLGKRCFITALTDSWEYPVDWNDPNCDQEMVERCDEYRLQLSSAMDALLQVGAVTMKEIPYDVSKIHIKRGKRSRSK
ncbi:MAG TPA: hypothetical protein VJC21_05785 [Candidatus Nanoarchaeia archaeon]|nr:hypothetical protein [Candidatus Nanoarchaeia archaeon]